MSVTFKRTLKATLPKLKSCLLTTLLNILNNTDYEKSLVIN